MHARLLMWSLRYRRGRHVLNALAMAATVAVVMLFVSVLVELVRFTKISEGRQLARILVQPKLQAPGASTGLPVAYTSIFQQIPGVKVVQHNKIFSGRHPSGATYIISGEEESGIELNTDFFPVAPDVFEAWKKDRMAAIVTEETAQELGLKVGQLAEIPTPFGPLQLKIVGLSKGGLIGHRIAPHYDYLEEFTGNTGLTSYRVFTAPEDYERVASEIVERTKHSPLPATAFGDSQFTASWAREVGIVPALLGFLGLFLVFTTGLTLANNCAIAIRERRTETATLRVLGYRRTTVARLLLSETVLVGLAGALLAIVVLTVLLHNGVQLTPGKARLLQAVTIKPIAIIWGLVTAVVVSLAGALPATISAIRTPLVTALRDTA